MKKAEAERNHRVLIHEWASEVGFSPESGAQPCFLAYKDWARNKSNELFSFRSAAGADYDVEMWFDEELKQTWRN